MGAMCSRTVTRVRRRAEAASPRTATGARRLAVDATAKDIGRELSRWLSSECAREMEEAPDKTATAERSQTGDRPLRCPPAQK